MSTGLLLYKSHVTTVPLERAPDDGRLWVLSTMARRGWELVTTTSFIRTNEPHGPSRRRTDVVVFVDTFRWAGRTADAEYPDSIEERTRSSEAHTGCREAPGLNPSADVVACSGSESQESQ